jgi:lysophospholipase L1-like esterase
MKNRLLLIVLSFFAFQACSPKTSIEKVIVDSQRFEHEIITYEMEDYNKGIEPNKILFIGSSNTPMLKNLGEGARPFDVLNRGFGGATTSEVNRYFDRIIKPQRARHVIVSLGENDIAEGVTSVEVFTNISKLFSNLKESYSDCKIIYLSMKPSVARWEMRSEFKDGNAKIKKMMEADKNLYYVETTKIVLNKDGTIRKELFIEDGSLLNEKGYKELANLVRSVLEKALR